MPQRTDANLNFHAYTHSLLQLLLWILPINLPTLVVWTRNLLVHWLMPFSPPTNIASIAPIALLVEMMAMGRMVPRVTSRARLVTNIGLFAVGLYAAVYGVTYAYLLHWCAVGLSGWLVIVQFFAGGVTGGSWMRKRGRSQSERHEKVDEAGAEKGLRERGKKRP
jgi:GPI inositol-deacylase